MMAASHGLQMQTNTDANQKISGRKLGCQHHLGFLKFTIFIGT